MASWYIDAGNSVDTGYYGVPKWTALTTYNTGDFVRQLVNQQILNNQALGSERVFICTTGGISLASEPTWDLSKNSETVESLGRSWREVTGNELYGWNAPHARLRNAFSWGTSYDDYYIDSSSFEISPSFTLSSSGKAYSMPRVYAVDNSSAPPTSLIRSTIANIIVTGVNLSLSLVGFAYYRGINFKVSIKGATPDINLGNTNPYCLIFDKCSLSFSGVSSSSRIVLGIGSDNILDNTIELRDTNLGFSDAREAINPSRRISWIGGSVTGVAPNTLIIPSTNDDSDFFISSVDLSLVTGNLVNVAGGPHFIHFENCKLAPNVNITVGNLVGQGGTIVEAINCDSSNTNYAFYKKTYQGTIQQETTIVRNNGASDGNTQFSRKMISSSGCTNISYLEGPEFKYWNTGVNSPIAVNLEVINNGVTLNNTGVGMRIIYMGSGGFPLSLVSGLLLSNPFISATDWGLSSETWQTGSIFTPIKQTISGTIIPLETGYISVTPLIGIPNFTGYFCPKILSNSAHQIMLSDGSILNEPAASVSSGSGTTIINNISSISFLPGMAGGLIR